MEREPMIKIEHIEERIERIESVEELREFAFGSHELLDLLHSMPDTGNVFCNWVHDFYTHIENSEELELNKAMVGILYYVAKDPHYVETVEIIA
tara:strand:- start:579 stop:860 length:282 start_codon:yes stop_codon:yes gene_type:complete